MVARICTPLSWSEIHAALRVDVDPARKRYKKGVLVDVEAPASGYRGVAWKRRDACGANVWEAYIKQIGLKEVLMYSTSIKACARAVAEWYAREFGPGWRDVLLARKRNPIVVRRYPVEDGDTHGGFYAALWYEGKRYEVVPLKRVSGPRGRKRLLGDWWEVADRTSLVRFPTRAAAYAGARLFALRLFGLPAYAGLYRLDPPRHRAAGSPRVCNP